MKLINTNKPCSVLDVSADDLAAQFTLIDLPIFKSIKRDELLGLGKSLKKQDVAPNVVAMNRQFNQITFWVVGQVLLHDTPRLRAELVSYFIKTAKRLYQLNNLHSSYAVISALLSSPIYRLEKTWHFVKKKYPKEKLQLDQLRELYSDNNNYEMLREHLATCSLPCIPYLGMYSRDIIYISEAHQEGTAQRTKSTNKILESIEKFQQSQYDHLVAIPSINCCLLSNRYIDELQKFVEDENYRRSLELEPSETSMLVSDHNNLSTDSATALHHHHLHHHHHHSHQQQPSPNSNNNHQQHNHNHQHNHHHHHHHQRQRKSAMLLASLTSLVQSAVLTTSNKFSGTSPRRSSSQKLAKYLIDDSFIDHTNLPGPIYTSS